MAGPIIIVTRGSPLALQQTRDAAARIEASLGRPTEVRILTTTGDRQASYQRNHHRDYEWFHPAPLGLFGL